MNPDSNMWDSGLDDDAVEKLRAMTIPQRVERIFELIETEHQRIRDELKTNFPNASDDELRRRYIARILPREDVIAAYRFDPVAEGFETFQPT